MNESDIGIIEAISTKVYGKQALFHGEDGRWYNRDAGEYQTLTKALLWIYENMVSEAEKE